MNNNTLAELIANKRGTTYLVRGRADAYNQIGNLLQDGKISKIAADVATDLISIRTPCKFRYYGDILELTTNTNIIIDICSDGSLGSPSKKIREFSGFDELWKKGYGLSSSGDMADLIMTHYNHQYGSKLLAGLPSGTLSPRVC